MPSDAPATAAAEEVFWQAVLSRDRSAAGRFVYAVGSTGIYCDPGCPSRAPRRENVRFLSDGAAAEAAGYRPCRRCRRSGSLAVRRG